MKTVQESHLFEVSWEVCNKVGGIYEVIVSKILEAKKIFGDNYCLIGPSLMSNPDFEETDEDCWKGIRQALAIKGIDCRLGRWNIPGRPKVILVNFANRYDINQLLHQLWENYGVDSLSGGWDYQEPVIFSYTCGEVISTIWQAQLQQQNIRAIGHFHEWMCGAGILAIKTNTPQISTVFTTHATILGRSLAGSGIDIYNNINAFNSKKEAAMHGITAKYSMECVSAREADVFTTVSDITAKEAKEFLHKKVDVVTTNGLDLTHIPGNDLKKTIVKKYRTSLLEPVEQFLDTKFPEDVTILMTSGRYEYHNKGIDVFIESLGKINAALRSTKKKVLALFLVMGGHTGINHGKLSGANNRDEQGRCPVTPFNLYNQTQDSILGACRKFGLNNTKDDNVQVVFVPAMLNGEDGFLNMDYFSILACCDLSVFPSWYEPWGYTPHEAAAYSVPTITTDLSGFGLWVRAFEQDMQSENGVIVIPRNDRTYEEVVVELEKEIMHVIEMDAADKDSCANSARRIAENSTWKHFYPNYTEAYRHALVKTDQRLVHVKKNQNTRVFAAASSTTPLLRMLTTVAELPETLSRLRELATNLWWSWQEEAKQLFIEIDPKLWEKSEHNPVLLIEQADPSRLSELTKNESYMRLYKKVLQKFDDYMAVPIKKYDNIDSSRPVAYFCCEFGLHESLPIYSGGLGILAGDHMKSVSDLALPVIGIGLLYRNGYFHQQISPDGRQIPIYPYNDFSTLAVEPYCATKDNQLIVEIELPGRMLYMAVWQVKVGRTILYLLDTDIPKNAEEDREITARLYEADRDIRLRQEIVLGMGGVRLCYKLGLKPSVFHMNEGHSAFLILELIYKSRFEQNMTFDEAVEYVTGTCILTTHTPIDAGNERFNAGQMEKYFKSWADKIGIDWHDFMQMGRIEGRDSRIFDMTVLGLRFSNKANAVSWLHGEVSSKMWRDLWNGLALAEVPIGYITNGIHTASFVGEPFRNVLDKNVSSHWEELPEKDPAWNKVYEISDEVFWNTRKQQKQQLVDRLKENIPAMMEKYNIDRSFYYQMDKDLNTNTLIIGFARRFAPYKRATLLFADPERLLRIINQADKPIIFVFAGKSHPADEHGIQLIQEVIKYSCDERFIGKIFFVEDYSMIVSKSLVQGCDVWLNNPRRPLEASGTSGQKVAANGGINFSISDGWWCEGYDGTNGWTIGPVITSENYKKAEENDYADAEDLYRILEEKILPTYYNKNSHGISQEWIKIAKNSMSTLTAKYSSLRMVSEYVDNEYIPTADRAAELTKNNYALAKTNAAWYKEMSGLFNSIAIVSIKLFGINGDTLVCGQQLTVEVTLNCGTIPIDNLDVQLVIGAADGNDFVGKPEIIHLQPEADKDSIACFIGEYVANKNGRYAYGIRVLPTKKGVQSIRANPLVLWG